MNKEPCAHPAPSCSWRPGGCHRDPQTPRVPHPQPGDTYRDPKPPHPQPGHTSRDPKPPQTPPIHSQVTPTSQFILQARSSSRCWGGNGPRRQGGHRVGGPWAAPGVAEPCRAALGVSGGTGGYIQCSAQAQGRLELLAVLLRFCRHRTALGTCSPDVTWKLPHHTWGHTGGGWLRGAEPALAAPPEPPQRCSPLP